VDTPLYRVSTVCLIRTHVFWASEKRRTRRSSSVVLPENMGPKITLIDMAGCV
jgi:hypothetical protein